ncbi:uncharacterized protein ACNLHF_002739 isoform 2-T2 [Anomaloglossus baeobatrachus]|uniref:uncharacterized protein LOC142257136 isoform X2 n=1 Tax=Anomaloglossus baeobatrachus TaxID=238106 RepID=UPI003F50C3F2
MALTVDSGGVPKRCMTAVRFKEVAVCFSEEEWSRLDPWQKNLYGSVMRDIHQALLSLGYTILHPDVLCRIRRDCDPYITNQEKEGKGASELSSDIIFNLKDDEDVCANHENPAESGSQYAPPASVLSPDIIFRIKHDENSEDPSLKSEFEFPFELPDKPINEEEKFICGLKEDMKDIRGHEEFSPEKNEASRLVFNPKLSIWIKQVDEVSAAAPNVLPAMCKDRKAMEVKTEVTFTSDCNKSPPAKEITEAKNNIRENLQIQEEKPTLCDDSQDCKGEESLLSIVLRTNAGGLYTSNYKQSSSCKEGDCPRSVPGIVENETFYPPKSSFLQTHNDLQSNRYVPPAIPPHEIERPFRCRLCGKCFKTIGMLNVHMKTHSGIRPYQCNECGKSFRDNWNLKVHQKIHTGETPYRCTICEKGFIQYATYMKHQRIHTGEKPYSCCYCDKSFTNSSNLVRHYRTHTGEKPYVCTECGKGFSHNTSLIQHKNVHKVQLAANGAIGPRNMTNRNRD